MVLLGLDGLIMVLMGCYEFMMPGKFFVFRFDDVEVREREFSLTKAGKVLSIEPKAFRVLLFLLHNPQKLITEGRAAQCYLGRYGCHRGFPVALHLAVARRIRRRHPQPALHRERANSRIPVRVQS